MRLDNMVPFRAARALFGLALLAGSAQALTQEYCSSENTGSDYDAVSNIYQSNGACSTTCAGYAFAIVQYKDCWCSNYIPADQLSVSDCDTPCPGYPYENCGSESSDLYGYVALSASPSGTEGAAASSTVQTSTSEQSPSTTQQPSTTTQEQSSATSTTPSTTSNPPSSRTTPSSAQSTPTSTFTSPTSTATVVPVPATTDTSSSSVTQTTTAPGTSVIVVTSSGAVVTETVTSAPSVPDNTNDDRLHKDSLSGGAIAGIVIGVLVGVAALLVGAFFLWRHKKNDDPEKSGSFHGPNSPRRQVSVLSKTGLLNRGRPASVAEKEFDELPYGGTLTGQNSVRHSILFGAGEPAGEAVSPESPLDSTHNTISSRRMSRPLVYDQRLNPSALFANADANGSRVSIQDQHDYSRPLGVANPDPRASFESRITQ